MQSKQIQLRREYNKLYNRLEKYGQSPKQRLTTPWTRDIQRLQQRWLTVRTYAKVYNRFLKSVSGFNEKYEQNIKAPTPHTRITTQTLSTLITQYEAWKRFRRNFVRKIPREDIKILTEVLDRVEMIRSLRQAAAMGNKSGYDQAVANNCVSITQKILSYFPKDNKLKRNASLRRIKSLWGEFNDSIDKYIYAYKDPEKQAEALNKIIYILTGNGALATDIEASSLEDMVYE